MSEPRRIGGSEGSSSSKGWRVSLDRHGDHAKALGRAHEAQTKSRAAETSNEELVSHLRRYKAALELVAAQCADPHVVAAAALGQVATRDELESQIGEALEANQLFVQMLEAIRAGTMQPGDIPAFESDAE